MSQKTRHSILFTEKQLHWQQLQCSHMRKRRPLGHLVLSGEAELHVYHSKSQPPLSARLSPIPLLTSNALSQTKMMTSQGNRSAMVQEHPASPPHASDVRNAPHAITTTQSDMSDFESHKVTAASIDSFPSCAGSRMPSFTQLTLPITQIHEPSTQYSFLQTQALVN